MQAIRDLFHTDKWWGKTIFIILIYLLYWCIFYWSLFLIPDDFFERYNIPGFVTLFYSVLLVPLLSFLIPNYIKKLFTINGFLLYLIHLLAIIFSLCLFFYLLIIYAIGNFQMLG